MSGNNHLQISEHNNCATGGHYQVCDDIEFPPYSGEKGSSAGNGGDLSKGIQNPQMQFGKWIAVAALTAGIVVGAWMIFGNGSTEQQHENWQHIAAANNASANGTTVLRRVDATGTIAEAQKIEVSRADRDFVTSAAVRQALFANDIAAATQALQSALNLPSSGDPDLKKPTISPGSKLANAIQRNREQFFKVHVFDCCDEDGDVVEILINGNSFATVPIVNKGVTLSIPLHRGNNTLTLRGVKDGRGGITVSFATSQGNYFCRAMRVGEEHTIAVVAR